MSTDRERLREAWANAITADDYDLHMAAVGQALGRLVWPST